MQVQVDRALDFLSRSDGMDIHKDFVQIIHMKIQSLAALQNYLNEDITVNYKGNDVKLVEEIFNSIQDQLYTIKYKPSVIELKGTVGKSLQIFSSSAMMKDGSTISNLPLKAGCDGANKNTFDRIETDNNGVATFTKARVVGNGSTLFLRIVVDIEKLITVDSLSSIVKSILVSMQPPPVSIKVEAQSLKIFVQDEELNLSKTMDQNYFEQIVKKELSDNGCTIVGDKNGADYIVEIRSNTKQQGVMWGNMLGALVEINFSILDSKTNLEIFSDGIQNIKGFQTTYENAGIDAYKKSLNDVNRKLLPSLLNGLFSGDN